VKIERPARMKIKNIKYHVAKNSYFTAIECRFTEILNLNYTFISRVSTFKILNILFSCCNTILGLRNYYYYYFYTLLLLCYFFSFPLPRAR